MVILFPSDFQDYSKLPSIDTIKECLQEITALGQNMSVPISNTDKALADKVLRLSYTLFCCQKQQKKTFTVLSNRRLKDLRILEDADGFSESDSLIINNILSENLIDAFAELVSCVYLPKISQKNKPRIFLGEIYSRYSNSTHTVLFVNIENDVYIFNEKITKIKLLDYVSNYFSATEKPNLEIQRVCTIATSCESFTKKQQLISDTIKEFNSHITETHSFIYGAITFLDFLAWKGLWMSKEENISLREVSSLIEDFKNKLDALSREYFSEATDIPLSSLISISDTIAVFTPKVSHAKEHELLKIHAEFSRYVLETCCSNNYAIRGAINYGEYSTMKNIMLGPGIDECASWHEMGNWIGVHLTPTAEIFWDDHNGTDNNIYLYDNIPLKTGAKVQYCVNWSVSKAEFDNLALKNRALLPEIACKYTNTRKFLKQVAWKEGYIDGEKR